MIPTCIVLLAIQATALFLALTPATSGASLPFRMAVGAASGLLLPGALIGSALGARSRHWLETLAVSAFGSIAVIAALGLGAMTLRAPPGAVIGALFVVNAGLTLVCLRRPGRARFLTPRWRGPEDATLGLLLAGLGVMAYRWADDVRSVGWELSLHLAYVRQYASPLPLGFDTAALRPPEAIAQNYLYLWEFVLAVVAGLSGVDPLVAALKCRWIVPALCFSSFFFMVQRLTASTKTALRVTWVMVAAVLMQFLTLAPNPYEAYVEAGPVRQVGAFLASIHHSDSAMEILLPALIGYLFWAFRTGTARAWGALSVALVIAFLWHPREYFQVMWYGAVAVIVDLVAGISGGWRRRWFNYGIMTACYVGVAAALFAAMPDSIRSSSEHIAGTATQGQAVRQFLATLSDGKSWGAGSLPFAFHLHGYELPGLPQGPAMSFSWLVLAVPAALVMPFSIHRRVRWIGLYLLVLWLTSLCSLKFQQLLQAITYGEMLISKPRLVHLFAYVVIGLGWSGLIGMIGTSGEGRFSPIRALAGALLAGVLFALAWKYGAPDFATLFLVLNATFFAALGLLIVSLRGAGMTGRRLMPPSPLFAALTFVVFATPVCGATLGRRWGVMLEQNVTPESLFSASNPIGLAPETLEYFRSVHPARRRLLIEPNRPYMVGIYAPVYVMPLLGNVGADMEQLRLGRQGRHPVYNAAMLSGAPELASVRTFLNENRIAHMLGTAAFAPAFRRLASQHPSEFVVRFESQEGSNVVVEYLPAGRPR